MMDKSVNIYVMQTILVGAILVGRHGLNLRPEWSTAVARYVIYMLIMKGSKGLCSLAYTAIRSNQLPSLRTIINNKKSLILFAASLLVVLYNEQKLLDEDFILWVIAYLIKKYSELEQVAAIIPYGVGMACNYFEGYLALVIPSDGASFVGFDDNVERYAAKQGVVFPVKKLFIIITKSLHCPPDLKHFNKRNREDLPYLEACRSLETVEKDVAGCKSRKYHNSAYKIHRPGKPAVYLVAECATPLHTLHNVLQKPVLYDKLVRADVERIVDEFCETLSTVIARSPECRGKCQLVYFDDTDPAQNLADILLDQIRILEPCFENIRNN